MPSKIIDRLKQSTRHMAVTAKQAYDTLEASAYVGAHNAMRWASEKNLATKLRFGLIGIAVVPEMLDIIGEGLGYISHFTHAAYADVSDNLRIDHTGHGLSSTLNLHVDNLDIGIKQQPAHTTFGLQHPIEDGRVGIFLGDDAYKVQLEQSHGSWHAGLVHAGSDTANLNGGFLRYGSQDFSAGFGAYDNGRITGYLTHEIGNVQTGIGTADLVGDDLFIGFRAPNLTDDYALRGFHTIGEKDISFVQLVHDPRLVGARGFYDPNLAGVMPEFTQLDAGREVVSTFEFAHRRLYPENFDRGGWAISWKHSSNEDIYDANSKLGGSLDFAGIEYRPHSDVIIPKLGIHIAEDARLVVCYPIHEKVGELVRLEANF